MGARRGGVVGRVLFRIENDLLRPVVLAFMHLLEIGKPPQRPHRRLVNPAFGFVHPPIFCGAAAPATWRLRLAGAGKQAEGRQAMDGGTGLQRFEHYFTLCLFNWSLSPGIGSNFRFRAGQFFFRVYFASTGGVTEVA